MDDESEDDDLETSLFDGIEHAETGFDSDESGYRYWYPTVEEIVEIHDDIIEEDPDGEPGIEDPERIQFAVDYIREGMFGEKPETVHEKAFALMRLVASNHWFVDGNKRTALNTTNLFYLFNGYELEYGEDLRAMLKLLAVREDLIDRDVATEYLASQTEPVDETTIWSLGLVVVGSVLADHLDVELADFADREDFEGFEADFDDHNG